MWAKEIRRRGSRDQALFDKNDEVAAAAPYDEIEEIAYMVCRGGWPTSIDMDKMHEPSFMMVLVGKGKYAYSRDDGVCVVPIGCLKN